MTFRKGYEVNHPLEAFVVTDRSASKGLASEEKSFIQVRPDNVVVSCVKLAEDSEDYIVRIYDATGMGAEAELFFGFKVRAAHEVDMIERKLQPVEPRVGKIGLMLRPSEIKTISVQRA